MKNAHVIRCALLIVLFFKLCNSEHLLTDFLLDSHQFFPNMQGINIVLNNLTQTKSVSFLRHMKIKSLYKNRERNFIRTMSCSNARNMVPAKSSKGHDIFLLYFDTTANSSSYNNQISCLCDAIKSTNMTDYILFERQTHNSIYKFFEECLMLPSRRIFLLHITDDPKTIEILEVYTLRRDSKRLQYKSIGVYQPESNFSKVEIPSFYEAKDVNGLIFDAVTAKWPPFVSSIRQTRNVDGEIFYTPKGMYIDIMEILSNRLNITFVYHPSTQKPGYQWHDMVERVSIGEYELAITGFSQTLKRHELVDFSLGLMETSLRIIYKKHKIQDKWTTYLYPFHFNTWSYTLYYSISAAVTILIMETLIMLSQNRNGFNYALLLKTKYSLLSLFALVGRRYHLEPTSTSIRVAFFAISFGGFIIIK